jgi:cell division protein FtsZ
MDSFIQAAQDRADREAASNSAGESQPESSSNTPSGSQFNFGFGQESQQPAQTFDFGSSAPAATPSIQPSASDDLHTRTSPDDEELQKILQAKKARIKVIGCGGAGNNTITRIAEIGVIGAETVAVNTDAQDLLKSVADRKLLIGKEITGGLGSGSNPKVGGEAAKESEQDIKAILKDSHMVFLTCGLGGGTGTGSIPVIAEIAKKLGILTVAIVTLPFNMEGQMRYENAMVGLEALEGLVDTLIVIPNDKLIELAPDLPLQTAFKVADEILTNAVKGIAELITKPGLINLDFADIKAVMSAGGIAMIGVGESDTENRAVEAVEKAVQNPLLDVDVAGATGALINVVGGTNMSLEEAKKVVEAVSEKLDDSAKIIWGAQLSPDLQNTIRAMLVIVGVKSPQIFGPRRTYSDKRREDLSKDLGIEFVD